MAGILPALARERVRTRQGRRASRIRASHGVGWCGVNRGWLFLLVLGVVLGCSGSVEAPEARYAATVRARAHLENGDATRAVRILEGLTRDSRDAIAWTNLGLARFRAGDTEAAEHAWTLAIECDRGSSRAEFWLGLLARDRARDLLRRAQETPRHAAERREGTVRDIVSAVVPDRPARDPRSREALRSSPVRAPAE